MSPAHVVALPPQAAGRDLLALRRRLLAGLSQPGGLVVDASLVEHLSPAGQAALVASRRTARLRGLAWRLDKPTDDVIAALRSSGLLHLLVPLPVRTGQQARPTARTRPDPTPDSDPHPTPPAAPTRTAPLAPAPTPALAPAPAPASAPALALALARTRESSR